MSYYLANRRPKQRQSQPKIFAAPIAGWIANRSLASPLGPQVEQGAAILDNIFPTATTAKLRRGSQLYATLGDGLENVTSMFSYVDGNNQSLFASDSTTIYDITSVTEPSNSVLVNEDDDFIVTEDDDFIAWGSTDGLDVWSGALGGDWIVAQFATDGGTFLIGVNGESTGFIYDGTQFWPNVAAGVWALNYDAEVVPFAIGEIITGGTSGATAEVVRVDAATLYLIDVTGGPFQNDETLTGDMGGSATADGAEVNQVPGIAFSDPSFGDFTTADMSYVWVYKERLFFAQKDSLNIWYLPAAATIGGDAVILPLGAVFGRGGSILFGSTWSLSAGAQGGLSEQCVVVTTEGEVAVFQGNDPSDAADWAKVGVYRIGKPLGKRSFVRAGGDLVIDTSIGSVRLTQAVQTAYEALSPAAISYPIEDAWNEALGRRGMTGWISEIWPESQMVLVSPPTIVGAIEPVLFVVNIRTGAWCRFTNWHATALHVFQDRLYFGSTMGRVFLGNVTGQDDGDTYTGAYMPLFEDFGFPMAIKIPTVGRVRVRSQYAIEERLQFHVDFNMSLPPPPDATSVPGGSQWEVGLWNVAVWNAPNLSVIDQDWRSLGGLGYMGTVSFQVTSGAIVPLDVEIIAIDMQWTKAEDVS